MARVIFFRCLNKELFSLDLKSLSYITMQNQLCLFVLCVISSSGAYRFINFDSSAAKNCQYFNIEDFFPYPCYPSPKSRWNQTDENVYCRNFSYLFDSEILFYWMSTVHIAMDCSTDQTLSDFLLAISRPPCLKISTDNSSEKEYVIVPPCRSYCKAAQQIFTSQL